MRRQCFTRKQSSQRNRAGISNSIADSTLADPQAAVRTMHVCHVAHLPPECMEVLCGRGSIDHKHVGLSLSITPDVLRTLCYKLSAKLISAC